MPEKYLTVALKRIDVDESERLYVPIGLTAGNLVKDTDLLQTYTGDLYKRITDYSENDDSVKGYYYELLEADKIEMSSDAHADYEEQAKGIKYLTSRVGDSTVIRVIDKNENLHLANGTNPAKQPSRPTGPALYATVAGDDGEYVEIDEEMIESAIKEINWEVMTSKKSPDELLNIQETLARIKKETESAIQTTEFKQHEIDRDYDEFATRRPQEEEVVPTPTPLKEKTDVQNQIDIQKLYNEITKVLIAQDNAARRTIVEISRLNDMDKKEYGILLTGNTGVGKTLLMNLISNYINRPILKIDSTQLTGPAYVGRSIEQFLWDLYEKCGKNKELAESAIIYFDEIDKKRSNKSNDAGGTQVQDTLLKFIEGTEYIAAKNPQHVTNDTSVSIKTNNMIVVASGAYLDVYHKNDKGNHSEIGFRAESSKLSEENQSENIEPPIEDFVNIGEMKSELMGRLPIIIHLDDLSKESIKKIILESDNSALKQQQQVFAKRGVKLSTKEGYITSVAEKAFERKIGARGINKLIADSTCNAYDKICCEPGTYEEVILTKETVENSKNFQLVKKNSVPIRTTITN